MKHHLRAHRRLGAGNGRRLVGGNKDDLLDGGEGNDYLIGGAGNGTYVFGREAGQDAVVDCDPTAGNVDLARFGEGIGVDQLWFRHAGNNLEVSVIGTADKLTIQNWYSGSAHHTERLMTSDNHLLLDSRVETLVQGMAAFSPPAAGETTRAVEPSDDLTLLRD